MAEKKTWKKIGGGTFTLKSGKIIKSGQKFQATEDEIPKAFRDLFELVETVKEKPKLNKNAGTKTGAKSGTKSKLTKRTGSKAGTKSENTQSQE